MKNEKQIIFTSKPDAIKEKPKEWDPKLYFAKKSLKRFLNVK